MYNKINMENILTGELLKQYHRVNKIINKIFTTIRTSDNIEKVKELFEITTIDYCYKLDKQGYENESNLFMAICAKFSYLLDKPEMLIKHKKFFKDLFTRLDYLIYIKAIKPELYEEEYEDFFDFYVDQTDYFCKEVYMLEEEIDEKALSKIITPIIGGSK